MNNRINELVAELEMYNEAYRAGNPLIFDSEYDLLLEELQELDPSNSFLKNRGNGNINPDRKRRLPVSMFSMNKVKDITEVDKWKKSKKLTDDTIVCLTPKYDGMSFVVNEEKQDAFSGGSDGEYGQASNEHYKLINNHLHSDIFSISVGELIIKKETFNDKYSMYYSNPRNYVPGQINCPDVRESLRDLDYIKYNGIVKDEYKDNFKFKHEILDALNNGQEIKVNYHLCKIKDLSEELFVSLFEQWGVEYELDGVIFETDELAVSEKLGREKSNNNFAFARAYKSKAFQTNAETIVTGITWEISKQGLIKPVAQVNPTKISGVIVRNCTLNNARYALENNIGVGTRLLITRSGGVIPFVVKVLEATGFSYPDIPNIGWNPNNVELICLEETDEQRLKKIIAFAEILEIPEVGEGVITQLWEAGYRTIKDILSLSINDLMKIEGFANSKSNTVFNNIQEKIHNVELSKLMHASGCFFGLGSKKLILLEHFYPNLPSVEEIINIEGFAETSALAFISGFELFKKFVADLPMITIKSTEKIVTDSADLIGYTYVFTGVRDAAAETEILKRSGKIGSSVSGKSTHLIMKSKGSNSAKENKAIELGLTILTLEELWEQLN